MKHFTLIIVALAQFFSTELYSQLQQQSPSISSDPYSTICSGTNYLPTNIQRLSNVNLIAQDKNKRLLFAQIGFPGSISILEGDNWSYLENVNRIVGFYSDKKRNLWVGVDSGAYVFNGITWKKYPCQTNQITQFSTFCEDKKGNIWAFSSTFCFIADTVNQMLKEVTTPIGYVNSATVDKESNMWVATENGVYKYDGTTWTRYSTNHGLYNNYVRFINCLNDTIYTLSGMTGDSIQKFNGTKFSTIKPPSTVSYGNTYITEDKNHNIWLLDASQNIYKYAENSWSQIYISTYCNIYSISSIFFDIDGDMWVGSPRGTIAKLSNGIGTVISNNLDKGIGFVNPINPFIDKQNNVWVRPSSKTGASKFDGKKWTYFNSDTMYVWGNNWESSFAQDKEGNIYTGGMNIAKFDGNRWTCPDWNEKLISYLNKSALMFDKNNHLWFTYYGGNIVKFDGINPYEFSEEDGIIINNIPKKIVQDKDNNIWVIYFNGNKVSKYDGGNWATINLSDASGFNCFDIVADSLGNIWFGTSSGLIKYNKSTGMKTYNTFNSNISSVFVYDLFVDKQNNLWMAYNSDKISIFSNETFHNFSLKDYSKFNTYGGIAVDDNKDVYLGTYGNGLLKISFSILTPEITNTNIDCVGADNGTITILPKKDLSYSYSINGSAFVNDTIYTNLKNGDYSIIGKKGQCYTSPTQLIISQPSGKFEVAQKDVSCYGMLDGSIKISTDGLGDVNYKWSNGNDTYLIDGIGIGNYTVNVKYGTCQFDRKFTISQPTPIKLSGTLINDCGTTGKINVNLDGGIKPYTINWSNGSTSLNLENLTAGNYTISVKDANNCNIKDSTFTIKTLNPIPRENIIGNPKAYICSNNLLISTKSDFVSYNWYKDNVLLSDKTKSINTSEAGIYKVGIIDQNNCYATDSIKVIKKRDYSTPQICLVTVDVASNKNKIIWNKFQSDSSALINILKETNQNGIYSSIGKVNAYNSGIFTDVNSDPGARADRYRINLTDECQINSDSSTLHKTIHLTSNVGINGEVNLIWSGYEGFIFNSYNIYRGTAKDNLTLINTIQSSLNSYTDSNPPSTEKYYQIEVISPSDCNPDALKAGIVGTRSNIVNKLNTSISSSTQTEELRIFPNPAENAINVYFANPNNDEFKIQLIDITGKTLTQKITHSDYQVIERENLKSGIYFIEVKSSSNSNRAKVILK